MLNVTDASFNADVENSELPVLVDFWATWCGPCKAIAPNLETLSKEYEGRLKVVKIDVDHNRAAAQRFGVTSIPTLIVFKDGKVMTKHVGAAPLSGMKKLVEPHLG